jgi:hypothetical protein
LLLLLHNCHQKPAATTILLASYLPPCFCFLIVDCFLPPPQLFVLTTAPTAAAMFAYADAATVALTAVITITTATAFAFNVATIFMQHQEVS